MHLAISNVFNSCILPTVIFVNMCIQAYMSDTLALDQHSYLLFAISNHLCCLLHLHQIREVVMGATIAPGKKAHTNQQSRSAACRYLTQGLFLHSISIFCEFYPSIQLTFFRILIQKGLYFDQTLCHKVFSDIVRSYLSLHYFKDKFSQSRNFYENDMILWYNQIRPKLVWKVHGA